MDDAALLQRVVAGDASAFRELVVRYHPTLVKVARYYVGSAATAEDVAQDTWIAVMKGAATFEGRSSFKTWLLRILVNRARKTGTREHRQIPTDPVDPRQAQRFDERGMWREAPAPFTDVIDGRLSSAPLLAAVRAAISELPEPQQAVVTLRDVEGLSTEEVADLLDLSVANVRVILHRGRSKVRDAVESTVRGGE